MMTMKSPRMPWNGWGGGLFGSITHNHHSSCSSSSVAAPPSHHTLFSRHSYQYRSHHHHSLLLQIHNPVRLLLSSSSSASSSASTSSSTIAPAFSTSSHLPLSPSQSPSSPSLARFFSATTRVDRIMAASTTAATAAPVVALPEWIVIVPDLEGAQHKRIAIRPQHLAGIQSTVDSGFCTMGGPFFSHHLDPSDPSQAGEAPKMLGSILMARANSKEEIMEQLRKDVYHREKVWNLDAVIIYPYKCAVRA